MTVYRVRGIICDMWYVICDKGSSVRIKTVQKPWLKMGGGQQRIFLKP